MSNGQQISGHGFGHGWQCTSITTDRTGLISLVSTRLIDSDSQTPVHRCVLVGEPIRNRSIRQSGCA